MEIIAELPRSYRLFRYVISGDPLHCVTNLKFWNRTCSSKIQFPYSNHSYLLIFYL